MRAILSLVLIAAVAAAPAQASTADTVPVKGPGTVNLAGGGQVALTVLGTPAVDATRLTDLRIGRVAVDRWADAQPVVIVADANGDGRADVTAFFDKAALRAAGELTATTTKLGLSGRTPDGRAVSGAVPVSPAVVFEVKFTGTDAALRGVLDRHRAVALEPLLPARTLAALTARTAGKALPDMASWHSLTLPANADAGAAQAELAALPSVLAAYPAPEAAPPPATPDFTPMQGYQRPAPQGVDADRARADPRSRGAGIRIVDLEYDWNPFHEDLNLTWSSDLGGTQFPRNTSFADEHGTAVFGELVADDNGFGVTGGVPDASMFGISPMQRLSSGQVTYRPGAAMSHLATILGPGDVVLIEQQTSGPNGGSRYVPAEWAQSVFDATKLLTQLGVVVVATGGNGGENLDAPEFQGRFNRSVRDSGAIIVGAGSSANRSRLSFSVYGSRVDLQGWGQNITTTGSNGNLQGGNVNVRYTRSFGGTSGAGPIVTGAVAALQSHLKATNRPLWTAKQLGDLLKATGTPQGGDTSQRIGPLPDLRAALTSIAGTSTSGTTRS